MLSRQEYEADCARLHRLNIVPDLPPWRIATWRERAQLASLWFFIWGVVFPGMLVGTLLLLGTIGEGLTRHASELSRCQKHAETPYDYHQCR